MSQTNTLLEKTVNHEKLSYNEQIQDLKNKGVTFDIKDEKFAVDFLQNNTYYFKLKSYMRNYNCTKTDAQVKYYNLDFAYLVELSVLDMYLRTISLKMCLDIEHFLKVRLIHDSTINGLDDGYTFVEEFLLLNYNIKSKLTGKGEQGSNSYCENLYKSNLKEYAIWNIVEVLQFGEFSRLYKNYYVEYPDFIGEKYCDYLTSVQSLRNAAAHNNCIINNLLPGDGFTIQSSLLSTVCNIGGISSKSANKKLSNQRVHDFVATVVLYNKVVTSQERKRHVMTELEELFDKRMCKNADYFTKNEIIQSTYEFVRKIIKHYTSLL